MDQNSAAQNRGSNRSPVLLSATLTVSGAALPVRLRNLSEHGALVEADAPPTQDSEVWFERKGLKVKARIIWTEGRFAGVAFDRKLEREEVLRQVPAPRQKFEQKFRRPGLRETLSEDDRKTLQNWAAPFPFRD